MNGKFGETNQENLNYCYHILINLNGLTIGRRKIQQLAAKFQPLGLHYSLYEDRLTILCYRRRNDAQVLEMLTELAQLLPQTTCYRVEAVCFDQELDFGFLLYGGALYRIDSLLRPAKPQRLVVGQRVAA